MCSSNVCVTQASDKGSVACCAKNSVHITWDYVQLRLSYGEFVRLLQRVERVAVGGPSGDSIEVDCGRFSFRLTADEHEQFADMLARAHDLMSGCAPQVVALRKGSHPLEETPLPYEFMLN